MSNEALSNLWSQEYEGSGKYLAKIKDHFDEMNYSRERWATHSESSHNLIPYVNNLKPNLVLDIGCGTNPYKGEINNVIGIDIGNYPEADINLSCNRVHELGIFQPGCADVVMALGSINFGSFEDIKTQIGICIDWCKPGGQLIMRCRLGKDNPHNRDAQGNHLYKTFNQHPWKWDQIYEITEYFKDRVEFLHEPVPETAAGGDNKGAGHGYPDHSRKIDLAVWYWRKL
jgi:hypothetical protein